MFTYKKTVSTALITFLLLLTACTNFAGNTTINKTLEQVAEKSEPVLMFPYQKLMFSGELSGYSEEDKLKKVLAKSLKEKYGVSEEDIEFILSNSSYSIRDVEVLKEESIESEVSFNSIATTTAYVWESGDYFSVIKLGSPKLELINYDSDNFFVDLKRSAKTAWADITEGVCAYKKTESVEVAIGRSFDVKLGGSDSYVFKNVLARFKVTY